MDVEIVVASVLVGNKFADNMKNIIPTYVSYNKDVMIDIL